MIITNYNYVFFSLLLAHSHVFGLQEPLFFEEQSYLNIFLLDKSTVFDLNLNFLMEFIA